MGIYLWLPTGQPGTPGAFQDGSSGERHGGAGTEPPRASGEHPEAEARLALRPGRVWGADGHSGRLDHALVGVEDVALEGQAEAHGLGGLRLLRLLWLGCLAPAGSAPLLEGGRQDLLGLGAQATCEAQRRSPSLHLVPDSAVTPQMEPGPPSIGLARRSPIEPGPPQLPAGPGPPVPPHHPQHLSGHQPIWPGAQRGSHQLPAPCLCPPCAQAPGAAPRLLAVSSPAANGSLPLALNLTLTRDPRRSPARGESAGGITVLPRDPGG